MPDKPDGSPSDTPDADLAYQQAVEYGRDLARVYVAERSRREELEEAHRILSAVFASTPDGLALLDKDFVILQANPAFCRTIGSSPEKVIGSAIADTPLAGHLLPVLRALTKGKTSPREVELALDAPDRRFFVASIAPMTSPRVQGWVMALHDQTERRRAEEALREAHDGLERRVEERTSALREANERLTQEIAERMQAEAAEREQRALAEALGDTAAALSSTLHLDEVLERILSSVGRVVPHDAASIMLIAEAGAARIVRYQGHRGREQAEDITSYTLEIASMPTLQQMVETGRPIVVPDTRNHPDWTTIAPLKWVRSYVGAPIHLEGEVIGFINLDSKQAGFFTPDHAQRLQAFGDQAAIAIKNAHLYTQAQEVAALKERQRLARDLHDAVSQTLWSASLLADVLPELWEVDPQEGKESLAELQRLTRGALAEMRTLLLELKPETLTAKPLGDLVKQLCDLLASRTEMQIDLTVTGGCDLPPDVHVALYRIVQEALNNVMRHASASCLAVTLDCEPEHITLDIADDGQGFDLDAIPAGHLGVGIMRERAAALGAKLAVESEMGHGTHIHVVWPDDSQER